MSFLSTCLVNKLPYCPRLIIPEVCHCHPFTYSIGKIHYARKNSLTLNTNTA